MHDIELISIDRGKPIPRHAHEEIADLLSAALLRLRAGNSSSDDPDKSGHREPVCLGFSHPQRVNANPNQQEGVAHDDTRKYHHRANCAAAQFVDGKPLVTQ